MTKQESLPEATRFIYSAVVVHNVRLRIVGALRLLGVADDEIHDGLRQLDELLNGSTEPSDFARAAFCLLSPTSNRLSTDEETFLADVWTRTRLPGGKPLTLDEQNQLERLFQRARKSRRRAAQ